MAFDPESATPKTQIASAETHQDASHTFPDLDAPAAAEVWRERGEELAPAIFDSEARPDGAAWNEAVPIASAGDVAESATQPDAARHMWLMPDAEPGRDRDRWYQVLLAYLRENYEALCQSVALVAVGALGALLVVGYAHRRSPLPAGLQGIQEIRQEVPLAETRRKPPSRRMSRPGALKSAVTPKPAVSLKSLKAAPRATAVRGKVSLASSRQEVPSKSSKNSSPGGETNFVAKDSVTRYGTSTPAPPEPK